MGTIANQRLQEGEPEVYVLLDDRQLRRAFLKEFLSEKLGVDVLAAAQAEDLTASTGAAAARPPALILFSVGGESLAVEPVLQDRLKAARRTFSNVPVIIISDLDSRDEARTALELGADGFVPTSLSPDVMLACLQLVRVGGQFAPAHILMERDDVGTPPARRAQRPARPSPTPVRRAGRVPDETIEDDGQDGPVSAAAVSVPQPGEEFSPRQCDVLKLLRFGKQNKQIAWELHMSESTVKVHVRNIMKKLGVTNRTQAAFRARHLVLVPLQVQDDDDIEFADPPVRIRRPVFSARHVLDAQPYVA